MNKEDLKNKYIVIDQKKAGGILASARKEKGLSMEEVGEQISLAKSTINNIEKGLLMPRKRMKQMCEIYDLDFSKVVEESSIVDKKKLKVDIASKELQLEELQEELAVLRSIL